MMRIGQGYDVHRFGDAKPDATITLGGVKIPYQKPLIAHSDGDVLVHALCDALLGAAALGDIGKHFPDTDARFKGADSLSLLAQVGRLLADLGYAVENIDTTIVAEQPKMAPHIRQMCSNIAQALSIGAGQVNVKATTTESLGFEGRKEGIAAHAVALLYRITRDV